MKTRIRSSYDPRVIPNQLVFHRSSAKVRAYGGAMGGGKSRAICEETFRVAMTKPGLQALVCRERHVSITQTTRRTMMTETIPPELLPLCKTRQSGGEDFVRFPNGSTVHFVGLDDPVKWFSSEIGFLVFDEAHEIPEDSVVKLITRLRQREMPCRILIAFNPENPGHWLYRWFIAGAERTEYGYRKDELWTTDAVRPLGDAEFVIAKAKDNPFLPEGYVDQNLGGLPELLQRRYLEGEWLFVSGTCYFDTESLSTYPTLNPEYRFDFQVEGVQGARRREVKNGRIHVYEEPQADVSYAIGADVATGRGQDFSTAYVIRLDRPEFVCEFRAKVDPDIFAEQLHYLGRWYGTAEIAVENQGGQGDAVIVPLRDGRSFRPPYPKLHRHLMATRPDLPTAKPYGYPMNTHTRPLVLSALAKAIREKALPFLPQALYGECHTFVNMDTGTSPRAQDGCNDDCVFAAAIALEMYRQRGHHPEREKRREAMPKRSSRFKPTYPWQRRRELVSSFSADEIEARYPKGAA
jgi:hypothetical protein